MKYLFLLAIVFGFSQFSNAANLGKEIKIYSDSVGPQFGTQYAYDEDKFLSVTFSLWGGDLLPTFTMKTLAWRLFDSGSGKWINAWTTAVNNSAAVTYPGSMVFSWSVDRKKEVLVAIRSLSNLKIVLSVDGDLSSPVATHFVNLGGYCLTDPGHFMNLTTGKQGCRAN